ncbi:hypothetical protein CDD81_6499 [Ophiocordyceps australis]|uniref:Swiss Army Knife protein DSP-PTPase phosphatase domain-containing protein n=1 Tax=Ophiocordyceps australis TaxID=1399860 RepID=A0A2C5YH91_9HYPO|nr:hypothetical protein CDD81_6499 [Ophiocordyceps australis]
MWLSTFGIVLLWAATAVSSETSDTGRVVHTLHKRIFETMGKAAVNKLKVELHGPCVPGSNAIGHGFQRFKWVTKHLSPGDRLARSSAPHYSCDDSDQQLTDSSIEFLKQNGINHIISLNSQANDPAIESMLTAHGITYTPLPVADFTSPTVEQLNDGYISFRADRSGATLVWCGFGHGRTGVMVTALQMFRQSEKSSPTQLSRNDYTDNHVETDNQVTLLDRLQNSLLPEGVRLEVESAENALKKAHAAMENWKKDKSPSSMTDARASISDAVDKLHEASGVLGAHYEIDRTIFDRMLDMYPKPLKEPGSSQPDPSKSFKQKIQEARERIESSSHLMDSAGQLAVVDGVLRDLNREFQHSRNLSPGSIGVDRSLSGSEKEDIKVIEEQRAATRRMFEILSEKLKQLQREASAMDTRLGVLQMAELNQKLHDLKVNMQNHLSKAQQRYSMGQTHYASIDSMVTLADATEAATKMAELLDAHEGLSKEDFNSIQQSLYEARISAAKITAEEANQAINHYIITLWQRKQGQAAEKINVEREAAQVNEVARHVQGLAGKIGAQLQEKAESLKLINSVLKGPENHAHVQDLEIAIETVGAIWMKHKEDAATALTRERDTLKDEVEIMKPPVYAFLEGAVIVKRESNMAHVVASEFEANGGAEQQMLDWRQKNMRALEDMMKQEILKEKEAERKRLSAEAKRRAQRVQEQEVSKGEHWQVELAVDIGVAVLTAIPSVATPIIEVLYWARQALRVMRFLQRFGKAAPQNVATKAQHVSSQIHDALHSFKMAAPPNTHAWAAKKSAVQIIKRLERMQSIKEEPTQSLGEVLEELESITPPTDDPEFELEDDVFEKPINKLMQKLESIEVPIEAPSAARAVLASSTALRSIDELEDLLKYAALTPHHSSDSNFRFLVEEAESYLFDPKGNDAQEPKTLLSAINQHIMATA